MITINIMVLGGDGTLKIIKKHCGLTRTNESLVRQGESWMIDLHSPMTLTLKETNWLKTTETEEK